ncbi:TetR/AcrR family transcriptional regulator [Conexibacter woesei]|uniref:Transcriptional regulator, TetR family n=1 Tax=Conexibacter woesei (strain DSM 14684 / CCUG 47730 / CIP 108061 / JCM 11494 / NBRC 100937 / ID131577) TaxID=469383 RepID=D3F272_CONWI|nr:TetR/AcrR family transcriptional regulator [Conexibacter woesei]ADB50247.1 transcriptional regulator, TetR family [Conexibacter woesei DSM 14684]
MTQTAAETGKRERTKAQNRRAILDAAREVFTEMGYDAASIRDVVRRTELASGTFYNYFPDKASVFHAVLEERTTELRRRLREVRLRETTLDAVVHEGFRVYFSFIVEDQPLFELLRRNAGTVQTMFDTPALEAGVYELFEDLSAVAARIDLSPAIDLDYLSAAMGGVAFELGIRMIEQPQPDVERTARFASELFLGGMTRLAGASAGSSAPA